MKPNIRASSPRARSPPPSRAKSPPPKPGPTAKIHDSGKASTELEQKLILHRYPFDEIPRKLDTARSLSIVPVHSDDSPTVKLFDHHRIGLNLKKNFLEWQFSYMDTGCFHCVVDLEKRQFFNFADQSPIALFVDNVPCIIPVIVK